MAYTTVDLVAAELGGLNVTASTTPSISDVEGWIAETDAMIDLKTGRVWASSVVTDEVFDANGTNYFKFPEAPIIDVTSVSYETNGLGSDSEAWISLTEGRTSDYILYVMDGEIEWINKPSKGKKNLKVTYTKGYSETPAYIQRLSTLITASRIVETSINDAANEGGGSISVGNISITDPTAFGTTHLKQMKVEVDTIFGSVGDVYVYSPSRTYDLRY